MPTDGIKQEPEYEYGYEYTGPKDMEGLEMQRMELEGTPPPILDKLVPSPKSGETKPSKTPPLDAPELPILTPKAVRKMVAAQAAKKEANPWMANPSYTLFFFQAMYRLAENMSKTRQNEMKQKILVEETIFKMGMENADFIKQSKDLVAQKEFMQALGSFANAASNIYQLGGMVKNKANVGKAVDQDFKDKIETREAELKKAEGLVVVDDESKRSEILRQDPKVQEEQDKLDKIKAEAREEKRHQLQTDNQATAMKGAILEHTSKGIVGVVCSIYTAEEAAIEKQKARNEALIQMFHKLDDGMNKAKDDLQTQYDKIMQQVADAIAANVRAHSLGRG